MLAQWPIVCRVTDITYWWNRDRTLSCQVCADFSLVQPGSIRCAFLLMWVASFLSSLDFERWSPSSVASEENRRNLAMLETAVGECLTVCNAVLVPLQLSLIALFLFVTRSSFEFEWSFKFSSFQNTCFILLLNSDCDVQTKRRRASAKAPRGQGKFDFSWISVQWGVSFTSSIQNASWIQFTRIWSGFFF